MILSSWLFAKYIFPKLNTSKNVGIEFNWLHYRFFLGILSIYGWILAMVYLIHGSILNTILFYLFNELYQGNLLEGKSNFFTVIKEGSPSPIIQVHSLQAFLVLVVYCYFFNYSWIYGSINLLVYIGIQLGIRYQETIDLYWKALVIIILKYSIVTQNKWNEYKNKIIILISRASPLNHVDTIKNN